VIVYRIGENYKKLEKYVYRIRFAFLSY